MLLAILVFTSSRYNLSIYIYIYIYIHFLSFPLTTSVIDDWWFICQYKGQDTRWYSIHFMGLGLPVRSWIGTPPAPKPCARVWPTSWGRQRPRRDEGPRRWRKKSGGNRPCRQGRTQAGGLVFFSFFFHILGIFGHNHPNWLKLFRWVETTNQQETWRRMAI